MHPGGSGALAVARGPSVHYAHESSAPSRTPGPSVEAARCHGMAEASGPLHLWGVEQDFGEDDQTIPAGAILA